MSRTVVVTTPENVSITYRVAGAASRFAATLIDLTIQFTLLIFVGGAMNLFARAGFGLGSITTALGLIAVFLILFVYAIFFEMLWGGRTPGKRLMGLRVIRDGGYPIDLVSSAIRNVLRFIDFGLIPISPPLILCGVPGLICIFFSPTYKRIGDYAAGTLVIVEAGETPFAERQTAAPASAGTVYSEGAVAFLPYIRNLDRISAQEYSVLRRFMARRHQFELNVQAALAERLARPILDRLDIPVQIRYQLQYADLLEAIERRYAEDHGLL